MTRKSKVKAKGVPIGATIHFVKWHNGISVIYASLDHTGDGTLPPDWLQPDTNVSILPIPARRSKK